MPHQNDDDDEEADDSIQEGIYRPWSTYLCSCQENCMNCLCVPTFLPCFMCELLHYVFGLGWFRAFGLGILLTPVAPFLVTVARIRIRKKHQLQGNICVDVCCTTLCFPCSACQVRDEIVTLRRDHRWRLAHPSPPGQPKHSPYIAPFCEAFANRHKRVPRSDSDIGSSSVSSGSSSISDSDATSSDSSSEEGSSSDSEDIRRERKR
ncbi:unnamed protein product [Hydatigera taeniaeformis]|uniref:Cys_knot domain-containing protein n=1 Tax=Hydatigena taeniaeformis TaxID=6205 RepID=A0A0R3X902_HYDTA|nr:unnamed protein product [Hydatigera taeniaeformis]